MNITAKQILQSAPGRFRPEKAKSYNAIFHFLISGDEDFSCSLIIDNGNCDLIDGLIGTPNCIISTTARTYIEIETGKSNPQMALMLGKIKATSISDLIQFAKCFRRFDRIHLDTADLPIDITNHNVIRKKRKGPLEGVKIIDFTRLLPGPQATMMLADMGADVIKVEDPDSPDYVRSFEPLIEGTSAFYYALNRNKRSLAINMLSPGGKAIVVDLIKGADILIEQYRPGIMAKFGLDYDTLKAINPRLIYISITGYGQESSLSQAAGHDINYISIAGVLGLSGDEHGEPVIPGFQLADIAGGSYICVNAVTAALYQRERTGHGEWIDVSMTDAVLPFITLPFAEYQQRGERHSRGQFQLSGGQANYNVYKCSDDRYVALGSLEPKFWNKICEKLGKPEWQNEILGKEQIQEAIKVQLRQIFLAKSRQEWCNFFAGDDVCLTPVNELDELIADDYLKERKMFIDFKIGGKEIQTISSPLKFAASRNAENWIAPQLGEDTVSILRELKHSDEKIKELIRENIIKTI